MSRIIQRRIAGVLVAVAVVTGSAGCAADPLSVDDRRIVDQLAQIAPVDSQIDGEVTDVECWKPSENLVDEQTFRVLCRLHYDENDGTERYRDMICIGDPDADPVTDYCYLWAYYSDMPVYEDQQGYLAR